MIDKIKEIFANGINEESILAAIKYALETIFAFVLKEEGIVAGE